MEEGNKSKKTVFVGGIGEDIDETILYETFSTFGDIMEVQVPLAPQNYRDAAPKHRGFAFVTFGAPADALDAIDNMDMNELRGRVLKVHLAKPSKTTAMTAPGNRAIWESEEWLKDNLKPLAQSGGVQARNAKGGGEELQDQEQEEGGDAMEE